MAERIEMIWTFMLNYTAGWGFSGHVHDFYQMYFAVAGEAVMLLDGVEHTLSKDTCLLVYPGQYHELPVLEQGKLRIIDTKFRVLSPALDTELRAVPQSAVFNSDEFRALQRGLRDEWASNQPHGREMAALMLEQALYHYLRKHNQGILRLPSYRTVNDTLNKLTGTAKEIAGYLDDHCLDPLSLDELAGRMGYNKNYLCKVFKDATGFTIVGYLNFLRIGKAYDLLRYSDQKVSDISQSCGFSSLHYFSRMFRKITGQTPSEVQDKDKNAISTDIRTYGQFQYRYQASAPDPGGKGEPPG